MAIKGLHHIGVKVRDAQTSVRFYEELLDFKKTDEFRNGNSHLTFLRAGTCVLELIENVDVHAIAHLTGGGFWENIPRVLPDNTQAVIDASSWQWPSVFNWLQTAGNVSEHEMYRTFNCGVGMVIALPASEADKAIKLLTEKGENAWKIGTIKASDSEQRVVIE